MTVTISTDEKVDWFRLIVELERAGYSHPNIAAAVGAPRTTILGWKQGATPKFEHGDRLIQLWCQVTANSRETVRLVKRNSHFA